jgi:hypothetical protein
MENSGKKQDALLHSLFMPCVVPAGPLDDKGTAVYAYAKYFFNVHEELGSSSYLSRTPLESDHVVAAKAAHLLADDILRDIVQGQGSVTSVHVTDLSAAVSGYATASLPLCQHRPTRDPKQWLCTRIGVASPEHLIME